MQPSLYKMQNNLYNMLYSYVIFPEWFGCWLLLLCTWQSLCYLHLGINILLQQATRTVACWDPLDWRCAAVDVCASSGWKLDIAALALDIYVYTATQWKYKLVWIVSKRYLARYLNNTVIAKFRKLGCRDTSLPNCVCSLAHMCGLGCCIPKLESDDQ